MKKSVLIPLLALLTALAACGGAETGTLEVRANGEDFVRQGFTSKDGWQISFDEVLVTVDEVTAYQTDPPYDPLQGGAIDAQAQVALDGPFTVDLAAGGPEAETILVGEVAGAPAGHYNALAWRMAPGAAGQPLLLAGSAEKDGRVVDFTLTIDDAFTFSCGEYVGDGRKGILAADGSADLEMTFHFDHIFGDGGLPDDDDLNVGAPGFEPFAQAAQDGQLVMNLSQMQEALPAEAFQKLADVLPSLGHVGEGHCHYGAG